MSLRLSVSWLTLLTFLCAGCHGANIRPDAIQKSTERSRQLTLLAAREASRVTDADARLTRQLNIANGMRQRFGDEDAVKVLVEARTTLGDVGKDLSGHTRLSGWVSISQLSREAHDDATAKAATVAAEAELNALPDAAERCQYIMGVAEEVSQTRGNRDAAALLAKGGEWVTSVTDEGERRQARLAFSVALFNLDAWEEGVSTLRHEGDAAWASDMLLAMSDLNAREERNQALASTDNLKAERARVKYSDEAQAVAAPPSIGTPTALSASATLSATPRHYGKSLSFNDNFEGRTRSK